MSLLPLIPNCFKLLRFVPQAKLGDRTGMSPDSLGTPRQLPFIMTGLITFCLRAYMHQFRARPMCVCVCAGASSGQDPLEHQSPMVTQREVQLKIPEPTQLLEPHSAKAIQCQHLHNKDWQQYFVIVLAGGGCSKCHTNSAFIGRGTDRTVKLSYPTSQSSSLVRLLRIVGLEHRCRDMRQQQQLG